MHDIAVSVLQPLAASLNALLPGGLFWLAPALMVLYSRISQDRVLDNYTRGQVHGYILANPGQHFSAIRDALGLNNGTLAYHLQRLQAEGLAKSASDGTHRRFYPAGMKVPEPEKDGLTPVQRMIVSRIIQRPGISQRELGSLMGVSPATINFHMERLVARGVMRRVRAGMKYRCFVNGVLPDNPPAPDELARMISAAP